MRRLLFAFLLLGPAAPVLASTPVSLQRTCPIGGEQFSYGSTSSFSTWGERPDGKPYGSWDFPSAMPECPGNGLILYKTFDEAALARLRPILESERWRALRAGGDTQYYRAYWLERELGGAPDGTAFLLYQATWEAPAGTPLRARYLAELAEAISALGGEPADLPHLSVRGRWINALRELGRFDEAAALLARTSLAPLDALTPEQSRGLRRYYETMGRLIARRDGDVEPYDAIPSSVMANRCLDQAESLTAPQRAYCAGEPMQREIEYRRQMRTLMEPRR